VTARSETRRGAVDSCQLVEQRLRFFEILCVEAFGEPAVDGSEKIAGFGATALVAAEPGEAGIGDRSRTKLAGSYHSFAQTTVTALVYRF
jgi:hypothetical protein